MRLHADASIDQYTVARGFTAELTSAGVQDPSFGIEGIFDGTTSTSERTLARGDYVYSVGTDATASQPNDCDFTAVQRIVPLFSSDFEVADSP